MPIVNFKCVREVSSEDKTHCAENLVRQEHGKKWRTAKAGEKSAYIVFELERPQKITGLDIGNEHSAFVEVQVGHTSTDFSDILYTCSFMTPSESKSSSCPNRVRCFSRDALVPAALEDKWSFVKVTCTQPFNTHVPYGLSFIKVHVEGSSDQQKPIVPEKRKSIDVAPKVSKNFTSKFGIKMREESPDSESESTNSLFKRWKTARQSDGATTSTAAAAIRDASNIAMKDKHDEKPKVLDRNRESLLFGDDDDEEDENTFLLKRFKAHIEMDKAQRAEAEKQQRELERKSIEKKQSSHTKETPKKPEAEKRQPKSVDKNNKHNSNIAESSNNTKAEQHRKRRSSPNDNMPVKKMKQDTTKPERQYKPMHQLLNGVVLVISGIQNPDRAELRNKAMAMGAKYKADWSNECTHLICAFKNTPKYNQVKGKGKIVTRSWIEQCYKLKRYLPWRRYALTSSDQAQPESDEEIWDISTQPTVDLSDIEPTTSKHSKVLVNDTITLYDQADDNIRTVGSDSDTDDEIQRVISKNVKKTLESKKTLSDDEFNADTEEEDYLKTKLRANA